MFGRIRSKIDTYSNKARWKKRNRHNHTHLVSVDGDSIDAVTVGNGTYGGVYVLAHACSSRLTIGSYCSIAPKVVFVLGSEHPVNHLSTFPFKVHYLGVDHEAVSKGDIVVGDDVWIGYGAVILSGVHIGQGAVIAAGAVVSKDVEPYAIVGGVPAKTLQYRFEKEKREFLQTLDYNALTEEQIRQHTEELYSDLETLTADQVRQLYAWFPKQR